MASNNDESKLINDLKTRALNWGSKVRQGNASHYEAWTELRTNMTTRLKYPLQASILSHKQCVSIMFPALRVALP